jgi:lipopolysaccharide export system protein LptC
MAEDVVNVSSRLGGATLADRLGAVQLRRAGARYSRFVLLMKLALPAIAILLVILVVVWPQFQDLQEGFRIQISKLAAPSITEQYLTNARFTGVDAKSRPYSVTAASASQAAERGSAIRLARPKADITLSDGSWVALTANEGALSREARILALSGGVALFHDNGMEMHTPSATLDLKAGTAEGREPVEGQGPFASVNAQGFRVIEHGERMIFTGKARLVLRTQPAGAGR